MKLYYFMIIAIGLMYTFHLAGIDTGSSQILDRLQANNNQTANLNPTITGTVNVSEIDDDADFWRMIKKVFLVAMGLTVLGVIAGSTRSESAIYAVISVVASFLFLMFVFDVYSVYTFMRELTGGTGWAFHLTWILIIPFLAGFVLSLIQFIQGGGD